MRNTDLDTGAAAGANGGAAAAAFLDVFSTSASPSLGISSVAVSSSSLDVFSTFSSASPSSVAASSLGVSSVAVSRFNTILTDFLATLDPSVFAGLAPSATTGSSVFAVLDSSAAAGSLGVSASRTVSAILVVSLATCPRTVPRLMRSKMTSRSMSVAARRSWNPTLTRIPSFSRRLGKFRAFRRSKMASMVEPNKNCQIPILYLVIFWGRCVARCVQSHLLRRAHGRLARNLFRLFLDFVLSSPQEDQDFPVHRHVLVDGLKRRKPFYRQCVFVGQPVHTLA